MASNTLLTPSMITREALRVLHQKLNFVGNIDRQYDSQFAQDGAKIGTALRIRKPARYTVTDGATFSAQDSVEEEVTLNVTSQKHVGMEFTTADLTMKIDDFRDRFIEPAMAVLAAKVEADALNMISDCNNQVGTPGTSPTFKTLLQARKSLVDELAPGSERCLILNTTDSVELVDSLKGLFQDSTQISKQYREGMLGRTAGFGDIYENTLLTQASRGGANGAYLVNGTVTSGDAVLPVDTGTGTLAVGDILTCAGVNRVHPETKADTGVLQKFVVTAAYAGGAGSVAVDPPFNATANGRQNITAVPADNAAVTVLGTASTAYERSIAFHKNAFTFATADLVLPKGTDFAAREVYDGISLRLIRDYDFVNDQIRTRCDVLYGYKTLRRELACRVAG
jgi:hypothetical protein